MTPEQLEEIRRERLAREEAERNMCMCLCSIGHPESGEECAGRASTSVRRHLEGEPVDVPVCGPCAAGVAVVAG